MPDEESKKPEAPPDPVADEMVHSAVSYRRLGQLYITFLAGIPGVTLLSSVIRAPGEAGFDASKLIAGLVLVAVAVAVGLALVAWLRAPVELEDKDLTNFQMSRILGTRHGTYPSLIQHIKTLANTVDLSSASRTNLENAIEVRQRAFQLKAADVLRNRVLSPVTAGLLALSLAAVTAGIAFLALAPEEKGDAEPSPTLLEVTLTPEGQQAFGCPEKRLVGLRVGGTEDAPQVVPLGVDCTRGELLALTVGTEKKHATSAKPVEAAEVELPSG